MTDAYFEPDGEGWHPTPHAIGPWDSRFVGGGPLAALVAARLEEQRGGADFHPLRFTIDFLRPTPSLRLDVAARLRREGKRLRAAACALDCGGAQCCHATAIFCRGLDPAPAWLPPAPALPLPAPEDVPDAPRYGSSGYTTSMQVKPIVYPTSRELGLVWVRFKPDLVPSAGLSPLARAAMAADAASGFAFLTDQGVTAMNCDLTLYLTREPAGEWLCIQVMRRGMCNALAAANAVLHDAEGPFGECMAGAIAVEKPIRPVSQPPTP